MSGPRWPQPFPDLGRERRREPERDAPLVATEAAQLTATGEASTIDPARLRKMLGRRADASGHTVRFEVVPTDHDREVLVVLGELVVRRPPEGDAATDDRVNEILLAAGYAPAEESQDTGRPEADSERVESPPPYRAPRARELPIESRELAAKFLRYRSPGVSQESRFLAIRQLAELGVAASMTHVAALQAGGQRPHDVVIKADAGPNPTTVTDLSPHLEALAAQARRRVLVAVIDTGIAEKQRTDGWLTDIDRTDPRSIDPLDVFPGPVFPPPSDHRLDRGAGHGTFAAGIIRQVDALSDISMYAALDSDGLGSELDLADAMIRAVKDGAEVLNLSFGLRTVDDMPSLVFETALDVIDDLTRCREVPVLVAAAGNFGDRHPVWPAASRRVVSVAALTTTGPADWSTRGMWIDFSTIGEGVVSTFVEGQEDDDFGGTVYPENAWAVWSGTSFAAPQIAGAVSRTVREDGVPPREAVRRLRVMGKPISEFGRALVILPGTETAP